MRRFDIVDTIGDVCVVLCIGLVMLVLTMFVGGLG